MPDEPTATDETPKDVLLVHGRTDDGAGYQVVRKRGERVEAGHLQPLVSGRALTGDVVKLKQRPEFPLLFDVETQVELPDDARLARAGKGPAKVANPAYRTGWDAIWGLPGPPEERVLN